jgi:hypothetical protein
LEWIYGLEQKTKKPLTSSPEEPDKRKNDEEDMDLEDVQLGAENSEDEDTGFAESLGTEFAFLCKNITGYKEMVVFHNVPVVILA